MCLGTGDGGSAREKEKFRDKGKEDSGLSIPSCCSGRSWDLGSWEQQDGLSGVGMGQEQPEPLSCCRNGHTGTGLCPLQLGKPSGNASWGGVFPRAAHRSPGSAV